MFHRFRYEAEFYPNLDRLPLHVRMKLDVTGIKLSLEDWLAFAMEERTVICHLPADHDDEREAFKNYLNFLGRRYRGMSVPVLPPMDPSLWEVFDEVPSAVLERSADDGTAVTLQEWRRWASHERYALYKTAISKSEPEKFFAVLYELRAGK